jgi:hypothetical protein
MNKSKRAKVKAKKKYLHNIWDEITEFQGTEHYDLMYKNTKKLGNHGIHNTGIEDAHGNMVVHRIQVQST